MIEAGATNPRLTEESDGHVFRIVGRDDRQGTIAGDYLADRWSDSKIAIVHDSSAYGQGLAEEVKKRLNQLGVSEALFATYQPEAMDYGGPHEQPAHSGCGRELSRNQRVAAEHEIADVIHLAVALEAAHVKAAECFAPREPDMPRGPGRTGEPPGSNPRSLLEEAG